MAQEYTVGVNLGAGLAGQVANIRAQLYNTAHAAVGGLVSTGFTETGTKGTYQWHYAAFPDGFEGTVDFSISGTVWSTIGINAADFGIAITGSVPTAAQIADAVWAYASRTLTETVAAIVATLTGSGSISVRRANTTLISITGLGNLADRTKLYFTVKESLNDPDSAAILQVEETAGLLILNGAAAVSASQVTLTVVNAVTGAVNINLRAPASVQLELSSRLWWDVKKIVGTDAYASEPKQFGVDANVTMAIS